MHILTVPCGNQVRRVNEKAFDLDPATRELATKTLTDAEKQDPGLDILSAESARWPPSDESSS